MFTEHHEFDIREACEEGRAARDCSCWWPGFMVYLETAGKGTLPIYVCLN